MAEGRIQRDGTGRCNSPFKYWLKESEECWKQPYAGIESLEALESMLQEPDDKLPPLLPPSIRKLLEKRKKRQG